MICIASGSATCPSGNDWSGAAIYIVLILAVAGYRAWKIWLKRGCAEPKEGE
jgi:hypothetical protein